MEVLEIMAKARPDVIWVDGSFYGKLRPRIVRDHKVCAALRRETGKPYFTSFQQATKELSKKLDEWLF